MNLLIDTHTFLWFVSDDPELSNDALTLIKDWQNNVFLSIASLWELAIKISSGKLTLPGQLDILIPQQLTQNRLTLLDVSIPHIASVATLPFHHKDPFDRMIIAQAMVEQTPIISRDAAFDAYAIKRIW